MNPYDRSTFHGGDARGYIDYPFFEESTKERRRVLGGFEALTDNVRSAMTNTSSKGKEIKIPRPDHPITISPTEGKVRVTVAGKIVAESQRALRLEEKGYPPVYYLPRCSLRVRNSAGPLEYNGKVVRMALQGLTDPARPLSY